MEPSVPLVTAARRGQPIRMWLPIVIGIEPSVILLPVRPLGLQMNHILTVLPLFFRDPGLHVLAWGPDEIFWLLVSIVTTVWLLLPELCYSCSIPVPQRHHSHRTQCITQLGALSIPGDSSALPGHPAASPARSRGYLTLLCGELGKTAWALTQQSCLQRKLVVATVHGVAKSQTRLSNYHFHLGANQ